MSPTVIRLDVLVEVIRGLSLYSLLYSSIADCRLNNCYAVSGNPQTFQQALLLIANLARLAPDSVLYNVMPVFTFMGSNVFHRDDSYSFKVVQQVRVLGIISCFRANVVFLQTIDGIVPVMVSSLKEAHSQPLDLYIASREFLRVFTDAANHIPRHRRNK